MSTGPSHVMDTLLDPRQVARLIPRTRIEFGDLYDQVRPREASRSFIVVSEGTPLDSVAFERALRQAAQEQWLATLAAALVEGDFLPTDSPVVTELQAVLDRSRGFSDHALATSGSIKAQNRLCRVEVAGGPEHGSTTGTGFLVGPSAVLTCFHVVTSLVDVNARVPRPGSERAIVLRFDHSTGRTSQEYRVPADWLLAWRSAHPAELDAIAAGDAVDLIGLLDFAAIQVAGSPGSERGYYRLDEAVAPTKGTDALLLQHPDGVTQRITRGTFDGYRERTNDERLLHSANALGGASGGLLVDGNHRLIGLHQGAIPAQADAPATSNTAISALAIRDEIRKQGVDLEESPFANAFRINGNRGPIVGRDDCQLMLRTSTQPFIRVRSRSRAKGVSFSTELMQACLPASEHVFATVEVADFVSDAKRSAQVLLTALSLRDGGLPDEGDVDSSNGTWVAALVQQIIARAGSAYPDKTVWIVIDEMLRSLPEGGCRDLLSELYRQVSLTASMRVVLLDLMDLPDGFRDDLLDDEDVAPPTHEDLERYVRRRLVARGGVFTAEAVKALVGVTVRTVGLEVEALAKHIRQVLDPELDVWEG